MEVKPETCRRKQEEEELGRFWGRRTGTQGGSGSIQGLTLLKHPCLGKGQSTQVSPMEIKSPSHRASPTSARQLTLGEMSSSVTPVTSEQEQAWPSSIQQWCGSPSVTVTITPTLSHL